MGTEVVAVASAQWAVRAMSQVPAVAVVAVAAVVQANAWSPALKWLSILSMLLRVRDHAMHCLPALLRMVALQTVDTINTVPLASTCIRHTGAGTSCGCSRAPVHSDCQGMFRKQEETGQQSSEDGTHLLQVVMVQLQMRAAQDVILLQTVTVSQTSHPVAVQMRMSKTERGLTWRSVSGSETRLRQQCDPVVPAQVSVAGVRVRV